MSKDSIVEREGLEGKDEIDDQIFEFINHLRKQGYTFREIVPRLQYYADYCKRHANNCNDWDRVLGQGEIVLPGDTK